MNEKTVRVDLLVHAGEVLVVFDQPYKWIAFRPEDAKDLGEKLIALAAETAANETATPVTVQ